MPSPSVETPSASSAAPADERLADLLAQAGFLTVGLLTRVGAEHDLSLTQVRVLAILRDHRLRIGDLAEHLGLERSSLSGLVDRAEERGLVRRVPSGSDRRAVLVELTSAGRRLANAGAAGFSAGLAPATHRLSTAERERLATLLARLLDA